MYLTHIFKPANRPAALCNSICPAPGGTDCAGDVLTQKLRGGQ